MKGMRRARIPRALAVGVVKSGFHPNTNREVSKLIFVADRTEARELWGARSVNSALQKVEQRIRMGLIDEKETITIETA